jgi:hypothetical protein
MTGEKHLTVQNLAAFYAIGWGIFIGNPLIDSFAKNPRLYAPMLELIPFESIWGIFFGFCGVIALIFSYTDNRKLAAAVMSIVFLFFSVMFLIGDVSSPGWLLFGLIAVINFIHWRALKWKASAKVLNG